MEGPKTAQIILNRPKSPRAQLFSCQSYPLIPDQLAYSVGGPEKAGVGGSIPSLATTSKLPIIICVRVFEEFLPRQGNLWVIGQVFQCGERLRNR